MSAAAERHTCSFQLHDLDMMWTHDGRGLDARFRSRCECGAGRWFTVIDEGEYLDEP